MALIDKYNDISISEGYTEVYATTSDTVLYTQVTYTHTPFFVWLVFWLIVSFIFKRLFLEAIRGLRKE